MPAALDYLGIDRKSRDPADLERAAALLERVRPYIRRFHSSQYINDLASGDICLALGYSGDVIQARNRAREAGSPVEIAFRVPREGSMMAIDMLAIPRDAPHPDNAHQFIDYILRPEVIAKITDAVSYPNPNLAATALIDPEIRDDPGIYPPRQVMQRLYLDEPAPRAYERLRTRVWNRVKIGLLSGANGASGDHCRAASRSAAAVRRWTMCRSRSSRESSSRCSAHRAAARRHCCG